MYSPPTLPFYGTGSLYYVKRGLKEQINMVLRPLFASAERGDGG